MTSTLSQLLFVYVLGGLTFVPLVLAAVLVPAWLALPKVEEGGDGKTKGGEGKKDADEKEKEKLQVSQEEQYASDGDDGNASGTFAVLRKYDLAAATSALAARSGTHNAGGAGDGADVTADGSQFTRVWSVFDRSRTATPPNTLSNNSDDEPANAADLKAKRRATKSTVANVFFIVIRHGHLMLYDSSAQVDVRHVISLAHHSISMSEGDVGDGALDEPMTDGDLFIKRTAILLSPLATVANGTMQAQAVPPKPFFLFAPTSIQKESFYHALLLASPAPPIPRPLDPHDLIKLQTTLHSTIITPETRALNAVISRIYLALSGTDLLKDFFRAKIEKKISRVQKPGFINALALQAIDLGAAAPVVANLRLKDLNISGDMTASCDVRYTGGISLTLAAQARLDLGQRFKARTVDLLLSSSLKRLSGHVLIRIKPPPTNRLWFCFDGMPDMEIKIEPVVSSRQITYGFILRQIEERIRAVVAETLVKPNWDDISFFDTKDQKVRGGIWADEGGKGSSGDGTPTEGDLLTRKGEKTMSMPVLPHMDAEAEGASSGTETPRRDREMELKRRSVVSLPAQASSTPQLETIDSEERAASPATATRPLRSPSLTAPSVSAASVALDDSSANFDPSHKPPPQKARTWGRRQAPPPLTRKEALDAVREMRDRDLHTREAEDASIASETPTDRSAVDEDDDSLASGTATPERTSTGFSTSSAASSTNSTASSARQKKAANLLAAATTATTAAKNWSWNAIQNRAAKNAAGRRASDSAHVAPQEPMGRGQPLPPPGMPLPGPQREGKSLWAGSGFAVPGLGSGSVRRKPVLPRRPTVEEVREEEKGEEFGAWEENSGLFVGEHGEGGEGGRRDGAEGETGKKIPPPLPKRRRAGEETAAPVQEQGREGTDTNRPPALAAARLASGTTSSHAPDSASEPSLLDADPEPGEADLNTATARLQSSSSTPTLTSSSATSLRAEPPALPARPVDPERLAPSHNSLPEHGNGGAGDGDRDPDDLVVVAAPVESGRNTPVPGTSRAPSVREQARGEPATGNGDVPGGNEPVGRGASDEREGAGDGDVRGRYAYAEDEDEEEEESMPKASFSRSRGDGEELHL